MELAQA